MNPTIVFFLTRFICYKESPTDNDGGKYSTMKPGGYHHPFHS